MHKKYTEPGTTYDCSTNTFVTRFSYETLKHIKRKKTFSSNKHYDTLYPRSTLGNNFVFNFKPDKTSLPDFLGHH